MNLPRARALVVAAAAAVSMPACRAVAGIFKAGMGVGIFLAVVVIGIIFFVVSRAKA